MVIAEPIAEWCERWLGSKPTSVLFASEQISAVVGLRLADGREIVVKSRQPQERLAGCVAVQRHLWSSGFPCPEPLAGPAPLGELVATAERYVGGGTPLARDADARFAEPLARQVALAAAIASSVPILEPTPYWARWDHELAATWPPDPDVDLNVPAGPAELDEVGERARRRLTRPHGLPDVIGHCDWESQNLGWRDGELLVAHDWDSAARLALCARAFCPARTNACGAPVRDSRHRTSAALTFERSDEDNRGRNERSLRITVSSRSARRQREGWRRRSELARTADRAVCPWRCRSRDRRYSAHESAGRRGPAEATSPA